jgi:hypothetical protein
MNNNYDDDNPTPREKFLRAVRETKYVHELAGKVEMKTSRQFHLQEEEDLALHWERIKNRAWTQGAISGVAAFTGTRKSTTLFSRRFGYTPSFNHVMAPSTSIGASVGTAVACWNRDENKAVLNMAIKLPLRSSAAMDEYCPIVVSTRREGLKTHSGCGYFERRDSQRKHKCMGT